ncbi:pyruvate, water dikinase regulatory protein [Agrilactobacillus yilanensis]|uniref:Putative pyruvate, phosphate dikinase regulatory protein n=1 Tax=Agrilactobacillus yilanensis TaxID=2485997 RepID=A0ABW4J738_9LACO|nr:pyruvate, water dikinase regulatory protein [Agrilactobacillus yilanensis]
MSDTTPELQRITLYIISDSVGETGFNLAQAVMSQFPKIKPIYCRFPFINTEEKLNHVLEQAKADKQPIVIHTLATKGLSSMVANFCEQNGLVHYDYISPLLNEVSKRTGLVQTYEAGAVHHLNARYFDRISAMEFAVLYDDGKDPNGFLKADVVLLGVSRTSKTPLSLFLANRNIKVANLPLVPQAHIPDELWKVDPKKIIGLTNDPGILNNIRRERMIAYGLNPDTTYSDMTRIKEELDYANDLYQKLGCMVINVANRSIEETATIIIEALDLQDYE